MKPIQLKRQRLWLIFVLATLLSVKLGMISPAHTQTPPNASHCEQLKLNIQTRAKEDASADRFNFFTSTTKKKKITDISKLYDQKNSQHSCFEQYELWDIYEKEYDAHKYPAWMPVFLVLFVGGIFGVVLSDALKKALNQSLEAIANWVYNKFAGTSLFENIALKKYRQALIDKYQKLKIPFRPNRPLEMREIFVPLKVAGKSEQSKIEARKAVQQYRRLMVKGAPGSGKSMLLKYLALSYADAVLEDATDSNLEESNLENKRWLRSLPNRTVAILLELNRLNDENLTVEKLEQQLVEVCARNDFPNANRFIREGLKQGRLMLLLDGLDEVNSSVRPHVVRCLKDFLDTYENCCSIITCRTAVYKNEFVHVVEQTLEIVEFNDQQIRRFLPAWKSEMPIDKSVEQLMQTLRDRPKIMTLARNPLLLTIISYLYCDTVFVLPHSRAEFYTKATNVLLELRDQEKNIPNQYTGVNKRRILQHLALYAQKSINRQQKDRRSLSYQEVLEQVKQVLPLLNLEAKEANSIVSEIVNRSGLLLRIDDGERYQFAHLSLQEYFVAAALIDKQDELIQFWQDAPSDWREIVKLSCGLANN